MNSSIDSTNVLVALIWALWPRSILYLSVCSFSFTSDPSVKMVYIFEISTASATGVRRLIK